MRIAIDTGGTFTDVVFLDRGELRILKVPSTPRDPAQAIGNALRNVASTCDSAALRNEPVLELICGTTVGTNALLERRGGRVTLVTTAGFEDVLEIGRQARPRLYDFFVERPEPLVPVRRRVGLRERIGSAGEVLLRPSPREFDRVARVVRGSGAQTIAVCLLFSFANPAHERAIARKLQALKLPVSVSHEILPEFREFERTSTTVVNAYLVPVMSRYLEAIAGEAVASWPGRGGSRSAGSRGKTPPRVQIMQSNGGVVSASLAAREPVRTILSGPAGGILGAQYVARLCGVDRIITFDMGGTSTDVALIDSAPYTSHEATIAELPVAVPVLDIHTVGAGGGSIARFDRAGALRVGPESAGADPGPICYGRGERPTVTDAQLMLGRIAGGGFLGGEFPLDGARAQRYMQKTLGAGGAIRSIEAFAQGVVDVANATMEKAIRVISVERGHDPRDFTLVAFGGAGGLHACDLAAALGVPCVLLPKFPGALSALGILRADVVKEMSQTVRLANLSRPETHQKLRRAFISLQLRGLSEMAAEGFHRSRVRVDRLLDCRYVGQGYELEVPADGDFCAAFHREHQRRYGYADSLRAIEIVNIRARFTGVTPKTDLPRRRPGGPSARPALNTERKVLYAGRPLATAFYDRDKLRSGNRLAGPAVIVEYGATSCLPPGWRGMVDPFENIVFQPVRR